MPHDEGTPPTRDQVTAAAAHHFPHEDTLTIMQLLDAYGGPPYGLQRWRVQLAILQLSAGDVGTLLDHIVQAQRDYRDVVWRAEYPEGAGALQTLRDHFLLAGSHAPVGYAGRPIPDPYDSEIAQFVDAFRQCPTEPQRRFLAETAEGEGPPLGRYVQRMATLAVRTGEERYISLSLVAWAIANSGTRDWRDTLIDLPLPYRSAEKLGLDPVRLFNAVGSVLPPEVHAPMLQFLQRSAENRRIEVMGWEESTESDGFTYRNPTLQ
jgi:hypothetical protein